MSLNLSLYKQHCSIVYCGVKYNYTSLTKGKRLKEEVRVYGTNDAKLLTKIFLQLNLLILKINDSLNSKLKI